MSVVKAFGALSGKRERQGLCCFAFHSQKSEAGWSAVCSFWPIPFVFQPEKAVLEIRNGKFSLSLGDRRGRCYGLLRFARNSDVEAVAATNQPDGQIAKSLSIPSHKNIPLNPSGKSVLFIRASHPREGRVAIVTNVAVRCGGREGRSRRTRATRTAKSCGPDAAVLASSCAEFQTLRGDGGKRAVHRGEHEVSRKTIAQGRPDALR